MTIGLWCVWLGPNLGLAEGGDVRLFSLRGMRDERKFEGEKRDG